MCTGIGNKMFGDNTMGKINSYIDPGQAAIMTGDKHKLDPLAIFKKKDYGDPVAPKPPPQAAQAPDTEVLKKRNQTTMATAGPTLLTGPAGVDYAQLNLGSSTLLGG